MPQPGKMAVVFLPIVLFIIALAVSYVFTKKYDLYSLWQSFVGANDVCSDWMLLVLIEPSNPWRIFWVALSSLLLSTAASIAIGIWFVKKTESNPVYIVWLCLTSSTKTLKDQAQNNDDNDKLVKQMHQYNCIFVLLLETLPMAVVQIILYNTTASSTASGITVDKIIMAQVIICKVVFGHGS